MSVEILVVGQLATNCYLFYDENSREAFVIDPGDDGEYIFNKIRDLELKPQAILATHAHFDHILAVTELKLAFNIPFYLNAKEAKILKRTQPTAKHFTGLKVDPPAKVDKFLKEGQILRLGNLSLKVLETPGHTPGSLSYLANDPTFESGCSTLPIRPCSTPDSSTGRRGSRGIIFTGDLIFSQGGYGRTDLQGGNFEELQRSIKKILSLPSETIIYPGHGESTTVELALLSSWRKPRFNRGGATDRILET